MKKTNFPITINELYHFSLIHIASLIIIIIVCIFIFMDIEDLKRGVFLWPEITVEILFLIAIIFINIKLLTTWKIIKIYPDKIESFSLLKNKKEMIDISGVVYYYYDVEQLALDREKYIVILSSNNEDSTPQPVKIRVLYLKKIQGTIPKKEWIEYSRKNIDG